MDYVRMGEGNEVPAAREDGAKYTDQDIRVAINNAKIYSDNNEPGRSMAAASLAQAMMAYNQMIDGRWM